MNDTFDSIFIVCFVAGLAYLLYLICDTLFLFNKKAVAKIVGKNFKPSYNKTYMKKVWFGTTKSYMPMQKKMSERYYLEVEVGNKSGLLLVNKRDYYKFKENDCIHVKYRTTRFSKKLMVS